jgi:hypothetical protein
MNVIDDGVLALSRATKAVLGLVQEDARHAHGSPGVDAVLDFIQRQRTRQPSHLRAVFSPPMLTYPKTSVGFLRDISFLIMSCVLS